MWIVGGLAAWLFVALVVGLLVGRSILLADRQGRSARSLAVPAGTASAVRTAAVPRTRRRSVPLPPVGVGLAAAAVAVELAGYLVQVTGSSGTVARLLSADAPLTLSRLYVALLFAVASVAAFAGAGTIPGRRAWWLGVGLVGAGVAALTAGVPAHLRIATGLEPAIGGWGAALAPPLLAAAVIGALWLVSRSERRDRRRVLGVLALYAAASSGLSAVSSFVAAAYGPDSSWAAAATFCQQSCTALTGVAFLMAVLVGVAPRLVLPGDWALRRAADAHTLELPEALPGPAADGTARG